jgi:hypothetical protein
MMALRLANDVSERGGESKARFKTFQSKDIQDGHMTQQDLRAFTDKQINCKHVLMTVQSEHRG